MTVHFKILFERDEGVKAEVFGWQKRK